MFNEMHFWLAWLLSQTFCPPTCFPDWCFSAAGMDVYYAYEPPLKRLRPDWFGVLNVSRLHAGKDPRHSFSVWDEGVTPFIVVEVLSPAPARTDLAGSAVPDQDEATQRDICEHILKVPYYIVLDRQHQDTVVHYFHHTETNYEELHPIDGRLWLEEAQLGIGPWSGTIQGLTGTWLRFFDAQGKWIPIPEEHVAQERKEKEYEREARIKAEKRVQELEGLLRQFRRSDRSDEEY